MLSSAPGIWVGEGRCQSDKKPPSTNNAVLTSEPLFRDLGMPLPLLLLDFLFPPFDLLFPPPMIVCFESVINNNCESYCFFRCSKTEGEGRNCRTHPPTYVYLGLTRSNRIFPLQIKICLYTTRFVVYGWAELSGPIQSHQLQNNK